MNNKEFNLLPASEQAHFIRCGTCGELIDCRQLDEVFYHETHEPRTDIQYSGSEKITQF